MNTSFGSGQFSAGRAAFGVGASNSPQFRAAAQSHAVKFGFDSKSDSGDFIETERPSLLKHPIQRLKSFMGR